ncbi:unnamed protein product, partial [Linum tenue]
RAGRRRHEEKTAVFEGRRRRPSKKEDVEVDLFLSPDSLRAPT